MSVWFDHDLQYILKLIVDFDPNVNGQRFTIHFLESKTVAQSKPSQCSWTVAQVKTWVVGLNFPLDVAEVLEKECMNGRGI